MNPPGAGDGARDAPVLFLLSSLGVGGSEARTVALAAALAQQGQPIIVAWLGGPESLADRLHPTVEQLRLERRGRFSWSALRRLRTLVAQRRVGTIVAVNLYPTLYARACTLLSRRPPRLLATLNTTELTGRRERLLLALYREVLRGFDGLVFGAEYQRALWRRHYRIGRAAHSVVIYNGIDAERFLRPVAPLPLPATWHAGRLVAGTIGQLRPEKGQLTLLRALALLRDRGLQIGLLIVGAGPERTALEKEIARLALADRAHLTGQLRDVRPCLAAMDLFVLPSRSETFSNAALEAMASGLPVICTSVGGMPEMLRHGGGLLVPPENPEALAGCIAELAADAALRMRLAAEARRAVARHFTWEAMVQQYRAQLAGAAASRSRLALG